MSSDRSQRIAALNDRFRTAAGHPNCGVPGIFSMTRGVADLGPASAGKIIRLVRAFNDFSKGNDPYKEHDFGALDVEGVGKVFWKIDYYADQSMIFGAEDPADPDNSY